MESSFFVDFVCICTTGESVRSNVVVFGGNLREVSPCHVKILSRKLHWTELHKDTRTSYLNLEIVKIDFLFSSRCVGFPGKTVYLQRVSVITRDIEIVQKYFAGTS
jgi:hypothetical protein